MYIKIEDPESKNYECIDVESQVRIPGVQEANDETGEFSVIMSDLDTGEWIDKWNPETETLDLLIFKFKGNIKLIKKEI